MHQLPSAHTVHTKHTNHCHRHHKITQCWTN